MRSYDTASISLENIGFDPMSEAFENGVPVALLHKLVEGIHLVNPAFTWRR
tara:strand:- start:10187 stop:10339 length:153 start_codon:yes stop_codon:yes gene_type:complete